MPRRREPEPIRPELPPERALIALKRQLTSLDKLRNRQYDEADNDEREWAQLTESIITRSFGSGSSNLSHFYAARSAGAHYIAPGGMSARLLQSNFEKRIHQYEAVLKACVAEIELDVPEAEIKGAYEQGEEYLFYRDLSTIFGFANSEVLIADNYLDSQLFDIYVDRIVPSIRVRVLTDEIRGTLLSIAQKYATRGTFELRTSSEVHDRVVFVDDRCWVVGQSIKDAAKKKPTYIVEHDSNAMRRIYEEIWSRATSMVKSQG